MRWLNTSGVQLKLVPAMMKERWTGECGDCLAEVMSDCAAAKSVMVKRMTNLRGETARRNPWVRDPPHGPGDITPSCQIAWQLARSPHSVHTALRKKVHRSMT